MVYLLEVHALLGFLLFLRVIRFIKVVRDFHGVIKFIALITVIEFMDYQHARNVVLGLCRCVDDVSSLGGQLSFCFARCG